MVCACISLFRRTGHQSTSRRQKHVGLNRRREFGSVVRTLRLTSSPVCLLTGTRTVTIAAPLRLRVWKSVLCL